MRVVSDTGPLHDLVLVEAVDVLPTLFGEISVPAEVAEESKHPETPIALRDWIADPPPWLSMAPSAHDDAPSLGRLDLGERKAILPAREMAADLPLMGRTNFRCRPALFEDIPAHHRQAK